MADHFVESGEGSKDPFFTEKDRALLKSSFIGSLRAGTMVAGFVAPVVIVVAVGTLISNFFTE